MKADESSSDKAADEAEAVEAIKSAKLTSSEVSAMTVDEYSLLPAFEVPRGFKVCDCPNSLVGKGMKRALHTRFWRDGKWEL